MQVETITETGDLLVRRLILDAGEAMFWHTDNCRRFTVVIQGRRLTIEYREGDDIEEFDVYPGMAGWDEPGQKVHRAVNKSQGLYEEVVTFYRDDPSVEFQPRF